jgi:hypothetical protein
MSHIYSVPKGAVLKPAYQTRLSAVTGMEKANQPSSTIERAARAERLRDYFDLQLRFAEAVAATAALPLSEAVLQCTDFYRRFGLGHLQGVPIAPEWKKYGSWPNGMKFRAQSAAYKSVIGGGLS